MGLLDYLTAHAMDEDYAFVSARRQAPDDDAGRRRRRRFGPGAAVVLAVFALMVAVAAVQTERNSGLDARERRELVAQVEQTRATLTRDQREVASLRQQTSSLASLDLQQRRTASSVEQQTQRLGALTGALPVTGPGVRVVADDAPGATSPRDQVLDTDLQALVNGFWAAGAEAISLNGQRITTLTTIRLAGDAITVNARSLSRPYVVLVVGDKDTLPAGFAETSSGQAWLDLQRQVGLRLSITPVDSLRLPGLDVSLRYAKVTTPEGAR